MGLTSKASDLMPMLPRYVSLLTFYEMNKLLAVVVLATHTIVCFLYKQYLAVILTAIIFFSFRAANSLATQFIEAMSTEQS